jgi:hypothetical protein
MNAVLDTPRAALAAGDDLSAKASATAAPACMPRGGVFEVAVPAGPLRLRIDTPALRHALDAAIALQRCEPLLLALEAWLRQPLDWRWTEIPQAPAPRGSQVRLPWRLDAGAPGPGDTTPQGSLELPWALLRALPAPDAALAALLQAPLLPAQLLLSRPPLQAEEMQSLEPGGALLLPESFSGPWQGWLSAAGEDGGVPVRLESPLAPRLASTDGSVAYTVRPEPVEGPAAQPGDRASTSSARTDSFHCGGNHFPSCEVRLELPRALPLACLAGWQAGAMIEGAGPGASLWLRAHERAPALCLARGRLMPWGGGWALAIEALGEADDATLPVI